MPCLASVPAVPKYPPPQKKKINERTKVAVGDWRWHTISRKQLAGTLDMQYPRRKEMG